MGMGQRTRQKEATQKKKKKKNRAPKTAVGGWIRKGGDGGWD